MTERNTESAAAERLLSLPRFGSGNSGARMAAAAKAIEGSGWLAGLDAIKVTGSNGKGSVAAMAGSILRALGTSVGLYTSPHLFRVHERIRVDGEAITEAELSSSANWLEELRVRYEARNPGGRFAAFEALTAVALRHFSRRQPETVVAEAGIGGRLDPVRIFPGEVVGLTSVDLEHTALLGTTLEEIALDKAALCAEGGVLVVGEVEDSLPSRVEAACRERGVRVVRAASQLRVERLRMEPRRMVADLSLDDVDLPGLEIALVGEHQLSNAVVAILLVREWLARHRPAVSAEDFEEGIRAGLREVAWPLRFQRVQEEPEIYVDLAHTRRAVVALAKTLDAVLPGRPLVLLTGVSEGRDPSELLAPLFNRATLVISSSARHRGVAAEEVAAAVQSGWPHLSSLLESEVGKAVDLATRKAAEMRAPILVAGSLFLAVEAAHCLRGGDPAALRFS